MPSAYTLRGRASELTDGEVGAAASIAGCCCGAGACGEDIGSYQTVCAAAVGVASGPAASSAAFICVARARSCSVATKNKKGGNGFGGRGNITTGASGTAKEREKERKKKSTNGRLDERCGSHSSHNLREAVAIYGTANARWYLRNGKCFVKFVIRTTYTMEFARKNLCISKKFDAFLFYSGTMPIAKKYKTNFINFNGVLLKDL